jgi:hypothetical protein
MFDDEPRSIENAKERSARHARLVATAVFFALGLLFVIFGLVALGNRSVFGDMRLGELGVQFLIVAIPLGIGMAIEVRKRW